MGVNLMVKQMFLQEGYCFGIAKRNIICLS